MPEKARIVDIERSLGFKWPNGIGRQKRGSLHSNLQALLEDIDQLKEQFVEHRTERFCASKTFAERCEHLFSLHGPKIWPLDVAERAQWLSWAGSDNHDGLYRDNLYYYNETQREKLRQLFHSLCSAKCVQYRYNQRQEKQRKGVLGLNSYDGTENLQSADGVRHDYTHAENDHRKQTLKSDTTAVQTRPVREESATQVDLALSNDTRSDLFADFESEDDEDNIVVTTTGGSEDELQRPGSENELFKWVTDALGSERNSANSTTACNAEEFRNDRTSEKHSRSQSPQRRWTSHKAVKFSVKDTDIQSTRLSSSFSTPLNPNGSLESVLLSRAADPAVDAVMPQISIASQLQQEKGSVIPNHGTTHDPNVADGEGIDTISRETPVAPANGGDRGWSIHQTCSEARLPFKPLYSHVEDGLKTSPSQTGSVGKVGNSEVDHAERAAMLSENARAHGSVEIVASSARPINQRAPSARERYRPQQDHASPSTLRQEMHTLDKAPCNHFKRIVQRQPNGHSPAPSAAAAFPMSHSEQPELPHPFHCNTGERREKNGQSEVAIKKETALVDLTEEGDGVTQEFPDPLPRDCTVNNLAGDFKAPSTQQSSMNRPMEDVPNENHPEQPPVVQPANNEHPDKEGKPHVEAKVEARTSKILNIELLTEDPNRRKFLCVSTETLVEDLFNRVQKRMKRRLEGQEVQALALSLPEHPTDTKSFDVDSEDPDTWKKFLSRVVEMEGDEVDVNGVVEL